MMKTLKEITKGKYTVKAYVDDGKVFISINRKCIELSGVFYDEEDISLEQLEKKIISIELCHICKRYIEFKNDKLAYNLVPILEEYFSCCEVDDFSIIKDMVEEVIEHVCNHARK